MLVERKIRKHVGIIHAYSLMTALQRKIFNVLLYHALDKDNQINSEESVIVESKMSFSSLSKDVNFNSKNTQYLKEAVDGLASLKIEWNLLKDKVPTDISFLNLRVLHGSPTFYQDGSVNFSFHKLMLSLAQNPNVYGTIDLELQSKFESKYSHALYENSTRFIHLNKNKVIKLEVLKKLFGVPEGKYSSMRELNRNVIKDSIDEVNDRCDFTVNLSRIKTGKKITGFEIFVKSKKEKTKEICSHFIDEQKTAVLSSIKQTFGFVSEKTLSDIFLKYSADYINEKLIYTKKFSKKNSLGFYPIPYFIKALQDDYKSHDDSILSTIESKKEPISQEESEWLKAVNNIKSEIMHWKRLVQYAVDSANKKTMENIIKSHESELEKYLMNSEFSFEGFCQNEI